MLGVADSVGDGIQLVVPQPTEWQRIEDRIDATMCEQMKPDGPSRTGIGESVCSCEYGLLAKNYNVEAAPHH